MSIHNSVCTACSTPGASECTSDAAKASLCKSGY